MPNPIGLRPSEARMSRCLFIDVPSYRGSTLERPQPRCSRGSPSSVRRRITHYNPVSAVAAANHFSSGIWTCRRLCPMFFNWSQRASVIELVAVYILGLGGVNRTPVILTPKVSAMPLGDTEFRLLVRMEPNPYTVRGSRSR